MGNSANITYAATWIWIKVVLFPLFFCLFSHDLLVFIFQFVIDNQVLPCLYQLLTQNHKKSIKKEACWTISNITAGNRAQIQVYLHSLKCF